MAWPNLAEKAGGDRQELGEDLRVAGVGVPSSAERGEDPDPDFELARLADHCSRAFTLCALHCGA